MRQVSTTFAYDVSSRRQTVIWTNENPHVATLLLYLFYKINGRL